MESIKAVEYRSKFLLNNKDRDTHEYHQMFINRSKQDVENINRTVSALIPSHFLKNWILKQSRTSEIFFTNRKNFLISVCMNSLIGYYLGD